MWGNWQRLRGKYDDFYPAGGVSAVRMMTGLDDGPLAAQQLMSFTSTKMVTEIRDLCFTASWHLFDVVPSTLLARSYRTWGQGLNQRTRFGHPPAYDAQAAMEFRR